LSLLEQKRTESKKSSESKEPENLEIYNEGQ
jgi:amidophosphoribosyltransferase